MNKISASKIKNLIVETLKENQAIEINPINVSKLTDLTNYLVICTANSTAHANALTGKCCTTLLGLGVKPIGVEGQDHKEWILVDFVEVILHIMLEPVRDFYKLDNLWYNPKTIKQLI